MRSRSEATEKLLAEARQSLVARTEENRVAEAMLLDATAARSEAEKKFEQLSAAREGWEEQTRKHEQDSVNLTERCKALSETLSASESSLTHAQEKIRSLTNRIEKLQSEAAANQASTFTSLRRLRLDREPKVLGRVNHQISVALRNPIAFRD